MEQAVLFSVLFGVFPGLLEGALFTESPSSIPRRRNQISTDTTERSGVDLDLDRTGRSVMSGGETSGRSEGNGQSLAQALGTLALRGVRRACPRMVGSASRKRGVPISCSKNDVCWVKHVQDKGFHSLSPFPRCSNKNTSPASLTCYLSHTHTSCP